MLDKFAIALLHDKASTASTLELRARVDRALMFTRYGTDERRNAVGNVLKTLPTVELLESMLQCERLGLFRVLCETSVNWGGGEDSVRIECMATSRAEQGEAQRDAHPVPCDYLRKFIEKLVDALNVHDSRDGGVLVGQVVVDWVLLQIIRHVLATHSKHLDARFCVLFGTCGFMDLTAWPISSKEDEYKWEREALLVRGCVSQLLCIKRGASVDRLDRLSVEWYSTINNVFSSVSLCESNLWGQAVREFVSNLRALVIPSSANALTICAGFTDDSYELYFRYANGYTLSNADEVEFVDFEKQNAFLPKVMIYMSNAIACTNDKLLPHSYIFDHCVASFVQWLLGTEEVSAIEGLVQISYVCFGYGYDEAMLLAEKKDGRYELRW